MDPKFAQYYCVLKYLQNVLTFEPKKNLVFINQSYLFITVLHPSSMEPKKGSKRISQSLSESGHLQLLKCHCHKI